MRLGVDITCTAQLGKLAGTQSCALTSTLLLQLLVPGWARSQRKGYKGGAGVPAPQTESKHMVVPQPKLH